MDKEQLKREIAEKKALLEKLEKQEIASEKNIAIKSISEFTVDEKVQRFDALYTMAESMLVEEHEDNDNDHYAYEAVMELLARDKRLFWNYFNKINR